MSTDVQVPPKSDIGSDKQSRRRSKDSEKAHRRSSNFQNKKHKHDHKFRKRSQSFNSSSGKFFPPYKMRKKDFIIPPTKFLLGGNITDPLNLNSLQDEEINRAMNAVTPKSSPLPTPTHRKGEIEVIIPPDITDPLNLISGADDATYEAMLTSPIKRTQKKPKKNKKRKSHRSSSGPGSGKEDSIEGAKLDQSDTSTAKEESKTDNVEEDKKEVKNDTEIATVVKESSHVPPQKRHKSEAHNRANLRKMELKERKADLDKIVSPVIPQPGAWNDRHRFRPPPQRAPQHNKAQATPKFKESNARFQYGNYSRYYGYRNPNQCSDIRLKVLEKHKCLFRGKDVLDIGCNTGHLTLVIARDFGPNKVVGIDIDRALIQIARTNIRHYVNCGKKDKFFPISMPITYGPIDIPGVSEDKGFPHNISFVQGNYILENDILLSMEQPQFDVIMCLSITKWFHLNWGDAGLKRAFKRIFAQLKPGGVLILEAQSWMSYQKKKRLTPDIWKNFNSIELFPHQFSQYLLSEVGFSKCEVIGSPMHHSRGFQRPIKLFFKEDPSFDTPVYSTCASVYGSGTPKYFRDTLGHGPQLGSTERYDRYSFRLPDSVHLPLDEFSGDSGYPYGTPSSLNSPESGFSESFHQPRKYPLRLSPGELVALDATGNSQNQREIPVDSSNSEESRPMSSMKDGSLEGEDNTVLSMESNSQEADGPQKDKDKEEDNTVLSMESNSEEADGPENDKDKEEDSTVLSMESNIEEADGPQKDKDKEEDNTVLSMESNIEETDGPQNDKDKEKDNTVLSMVYNIEESDGPQKDKDKEEDNTVVSMESNIEETDGSQKDKDKEEDNTALYMESNTQDSDGSEKGKEEDNILLSMESNSQEAAPETDEGDGIKVKETIIEDKVTIENNPIQKSLQSIQKDNVSNESTEENAQPAEILLSVADKDENFRTCETRCNVLGQIDTENIAHVESETFNQLLMPFVSTESGETDLEDTTLKEDIVASK